MCLKLRQIINQFYRRFIDLPYCYESRRKILGFPLLSVNIGFEQTDKLRHTRGIVAIGNKATGLLAIGIFSARGIIAVAPVAIGFGVVSVASAGLTAVCVLGLGVISVSIFAFGYLAVGIVAVGIKAVGIFGLGYKVTGIIGLGQHVRALKF